jgi:predicted metal-binding membrane protein
MAAGEAMDGMLMPGFAAWSAADAVFMLIMWSVMMVGMMLPSAAPMILLYARVGREAAKQNKPFVSSAWFASGYLAAWLAFSTLATAAQWLLERTALLMPGMQSASPIFAAAVLLMAGIYQWTPLKDACLSQCQSPLAFIQRHGGFRRDAAGSLRLGLRHGAYCIGCCWALMALLFVGGVMNIVWIAAIGAFVLAEKLIPHGKLISRVSGAAMIIAGIGLLYLASAT